MVRHINFVLWLSDGQTFSDQPVVVNPFDGVRSFFGVFIIQPVTVVSVLSSTVAA